MRTVSGSEFQTDGTENRKARLEIEGYVPLSAPGSRDVREWLSTFPFPFPSIPIYSIPSPSHPIPNFLTYSHSHGIPVLGIPIPSHSYSVNAKVVYNY